MHHLFVYQVDLVTINRGLLPSVIGVGLRKVVQNNGLKNVLKR